ncbi:unnamed protein product [Schistosoma mattheei]|uniref:Uncharacterized protein n=1 Tax=Schistosoma mattheei TaxID=31246 RepID=A0AA85BFA9_9TREM|nr:unnamed protein product [Schistosoma mattheei]
MNVLFMATINYNMSSSHSNRSTPISRTPITVTNTSTTTTTTTTTKTPHSYQHPNYLDKESLAATKIQAGYRGYCTRKKYGNLSLNSSSPSSNYNVTSSRQLYTTHQSPLRNNNDLENAATRIQASYREYTPIKNISYHNDKINRINGNKNGDNDDDDDDDGKVKAVTKIQAGYRGYKTRKSLAPLLHSQQNLLLSNKENQNYLEYKSINQDKHNNNNNHLHDLDNPELAAIKIQATYRGYRTRRHLPK